MMSEVFNECFNKQVFAFPMADNIQVTVCYVDVEWNSSYKQWIKYLKGFKHGMINQRFVSPLLLFISRFQVIDGFKI